MIKANELRVGNYVKFIDSEEFHKVEGMVNPINNEERVIQLYGNCIPNREDQIYPVPLTPEVLEKCGFNKDPEWWGDLISYYNRKIEGVEDIGPSIDIRFGNEESDLEELDALFIGQQDFKRIKYLHQLQNLYFTLTGEELDERKVN